MTVDLDPPVSVIIPTYNGAPYLREALDSITNQTFRDFEAIIIDDVSSDNTVEIAREYAAKDSRLRVFQNEANLGFAGNRNKAVMLARGRYIAWLDQDDIAMPERLELQYRLLESDERLGLVGGAMAVFNEKGQVRVRHYPTEDAEIREMIFRFSPIALPACMMRKNVFLGVGGYSLRWSPAGDLDMTFKIGLSHRLGNVGQVVVRYRSHQNSATTRHLRRIERDSIRIRFGYAMSGVYRMTPLDFLYNITHYMSIWIIPPKLKIWLFNKVRDAAA